MPLRLTFTVRREVNRRMAKLSPTEAKDKHYRNTTAALEDLARGVDNVTTAPSASAIKAKTKFRQNLLASIDDGTWEKNLGAYGLAEWQNDMKTKAVERIPGGLEAAGSKVEDFFGKLFPYQDALVREVKGMSNLTLEDSIKRMTAFCRGMAKFSYK